MDRRILVWLIAFIVFSTTCVIAQQGEAGPPRPTLKRRTEGDAVTQSNLDQRVADLSEQISTEMTENRKRTIAVVEFVDLKGIVTDFGRYLSEELITRLFQTKKFTVIERQMLNKVIAEQKLTLTGTFDQSSARQLGRLLGVDAICSGTIGDLGQSLKVNARLISAETGTIFAVASTEILKDDSVLKLMGGVATSSSGTKSEESSSSAKTAVQKVKSHFFTLELKQCRISGSTVMCDLVITNDDRDRQFGWGLTTKVFDDFGNEAPVEYGSSLANREGQYPNATLVSGVPTRARLRFEPVSAQATKITLMNIWVVVTSLDYRDRDDFDVQFRNIPLLR